MINDPPHRPALIYSEHYDIDLNGLEKRYCFDMRKYRRIYESLCDEASLQADFLSPDPLTDETLFIVHDPEYVASLYRPEYMADVLEFPPLRSLPPHLIRDALMKGILHISGGTLLACREALARGLAFNLGGGYHHAQADQGGGFCAVADVPIAIRTLLAEGMIHRAAIVDCDVHQGNGNAQIFRDDPRVYTFSIHQENNYPFVKAESSLDIGFNSKRKVDDVLYLATLLKSLPKVIRRSRADLVVYLAGTDVHADDFMGGFRLTREGIVRRDLMVFETARAEGIPLAAVTAGGYAEASWEIHAASIKAILSAWRR